MKISDLTFLAFQLNAAIDTGNNEDATSDVVQREIQAGTTDGAVIIDAMDLLYTGRFSGFCIVSSNSDFARLAARICEQGLTVYGFGERKTPAPSSPPATSSFISTC